MPPQSKAGSLRQSMCQGTNMDTQKGINEACIMGAQMVHHTARVVINLQDTLLWQQSENHNSRVRATGSSVRATCSKVRSTSSQKGTE